MDSIEECRRAADELDNAEAVRNATIHVARQEGRSLRAIADAVRMSHAGVAKVLARSKGTQDA